MRSAFRNKHAWTQQSEEEQEGMGRQLNAHDICFPSGEMDVRQHPTNHYLLLNDRRLKASRPNRMLLNRRPFPQKLPFLIKQEAAPPPQLKIDNQKRNTSILNAMIDIFKPEENTRQKIKSKHSDLFQSEFNHLADPPRRPRLIDVKANHEYVTRRRIVSEKKSRPKLVQAKNNNFDCIQIMTFSSKFPFKKPQIKEEEEKNEFLD